LEDKKFVVCCIEEAVENSSYVFASLAVATTVNATGGQVFD
jgi:hypothetical protein